MTNTTVEAAYAFLRSHSRADLQFEEHLRPLKYVIAPSGRLVAPLMVAMIRSFDAVLFIPEASDAALELQVTIDAFDEQGPDGAAADRWRIHHGEPPDVNWGFLDIDAARYDTVIIDGEALLRPNPLAGAEPALCRWLNRDRPDDLRRLCHHAGAAVEDPVMVAIDPLGVDVRGQFEVRRISAPEPMETEDDARRVLQAMIDAASAGAPMAEQPRIVITRRLPGDPERRFADALDGVDVWTYPHDRTIPRDELLSAVRGAAAVVSTPADANIDDELFDAAGPALRIVSNYAVGVDNVDVAAAARRGIVIGHTPNAVTEPTADVAWLLMLAAARRAGEAERLVRSGAWTGVAPRQLLGRRLVGGTLLIVGAGRIGHAVARRAAPWEMNVLYHARSRHPEFEAAPMHATRVELDDGLARADVVSLHTPLTPETRHLIDARRLSLMKPTAILVNTARGAVVDEAALARALADGRIAAAGLDVYEAEPRVHPGLLALDNAVLLPHLGSATEEDRTWMMEIAIDNVIAVLRGETPPHTVTAPVGAARAAPRPE